MRGLFLVFACILVGCSQTSSDAERTQRTVIEAVQDLDPGNHAALYLLEDGEHAIVGSRHGFAVVDSGLNLVKSVRFDTPSFLNQPISANAIQAITRKTVTKYSVYDDTIVTTAIDIPDAYHAAPLLRSWAMPLTAEKSVLPYVYRSKKRWDTNRLMGWNYKLDAFIGGETLDWRDWFRFGLSKTPLLKLRYAERRNQTAVDVHYRDAASNGLEMQQAFTRSVQTASIWMQPGRQSGQAILYIDGDVLGPTVFELEPVDEGYALRKRRLSLDKKFYNLLFAIDTQKFLGRVNYVAPFDIIETGEADTSYVVAALAHIPESAIAVGSLQVDETHRVVMGRFSAHDHSVWLFRYQDGTYVQTQLREPATLVGEFDIVHYDIGGEPIAAHVYRPQTPDVAGTVIYVHGGPFARIGRHDLKATQPWLKRGYEIVVVGYRGTVGYGARHAALLMNGGVSGIGPELAFFVQQARSAYPGKPVGFVGNSFAGLATGFAMQDNPELVDFLWLDVPALSICDMLRKALLNDDGEWRKTRYLTGRHVWELLFFEYAEEQRVCTKARRFETHEGQKEPMIAIHEAAMQARPYHIFQGVDDTIVSPKINRSVGTIETRHACSAYTPVPFMGHRQKFLGFREFWVHVFMQCAEADFASRQAAPG